MKKKLLLVTLMVLLFVCVLAIAISATEIDGLHYTLTDSTDIEGYDGTAALEKEGKNRSITTEAVVIPESVTYDGKTYLVTQVLYRSFNGNQKIKSIEIPSSVVKFENQAFSNCVNLKTVNYKGTLEQWVAITFDSSNESFDANPMNCGAILQFNGQTVSEIVLPSTITEVKTNAFAGCTSITKIVVPTNITKFNTNAFRNIPTDVRCEYAGTIEQWYTTITFSNGYASPAKQLYINEALVTSVVVPEDIKTLKGYAFGNNESVTSVILHSNITSVTTAFAYSNVTHIDMSMTKVTTIDQYAFRESKAVTIKLPTTVKEIKAMAFNNSRLLEFVDFGNNTNNITATTHAIFQNCVSLKAFRVPDGMTQIPDRFLNGCTALTAVYLPDGITMIKGNQGDNQAAFYNSPNLYFVNEDFSVTKADGSFYTAEEWDAVKPAKPEVYYFPSALKLLCGTHNPNGNISADNFVDGMTKNGGHDDIGISNCKGLNSVLVLPEGFTGYDEITDTQNENQRGDMLGSGLFKNCGSAENPITVVFMGRIDRVSMDRRYGNTRYTTYVFANPENTGFNDTLIGTYYTDSDTNYSDQDEMYVVFCHAAGGAQRYKIEFKGSADNKKTPVLVTTLVEGATHINNPKAQGDRVISGANCTDDEIVVDICFCTKRFNEHSVDGTALGHDEKVVSITYQNGNYTVNGIKHICCDRENCEYETDKIAYAIFTGFLYATRQEDDGYCGLVFTYNINLDALNEYEAVVGYTLVFGSLSVAEHNLNENNTSPIGADGKANQDKVVRAQLSGTEISHVDYIIRGQADAWNAVFDKETGATIKDVPFYILGYVIEGENVYYFCGENTNKNIKEMNTISYNGATA